MKAMAMTTRISVSPVPVVGRICTANVVPPAAPALAVDAASAGMTGLDAALIPLMLFLRLLVRPAVERWQGNTTLREFRSLSVVA